MFFIVGDYKLLLSYVSLSGNSNKNIEKKYGQYLKYYSNSHLEILNQDAFKCPDLEKISLYFGINRFILIDILNPKYYNRKNLARSIVSALQMAANNVW